MKILNVNSTLDPVTGGGTAERTLQLSHALSEAGVECNIMTTDVGFENNSSFKLPELKNGRVIAYQSMCKRFYIPRVKYSEIRKEVENVDIVHLMGHWSVLNAMVYMAIRATRKPYVVCPAGALPIFGRSKWLKILYNWILGRQIIRNANAWIAITDDERANFEDYAVNRDSVFIVPNGVNPSDFLTQNLSAFSAKYKLGSQPFMLFLGRVNTIKGPDLLLKAFIEGQSLWPDWHLVFAGPDGGLLDSLIKMAEDSSARERIHFIGYIGGAEKSIAYHAANFLVIPSRQEAMSIVVLEAGISGTPVLLTDQCGFNEVARIDGGKVTTATINGLNSGLGEMIKNSDRLPEMGARLKDFVQDNYTWPVAVKKYLALYNKILNKS